MKLPGIFTKALENTLPGWLIISFVLPVIALWAGIGGLADGEIDVRGASVAGFPARLYASGFISYGLGTLALPRHDLSSSSFHPARLMIGMTLSCLFIIAATIMLLV